MQTVARGMMYFITFEITWGHRRSQYFLSVLCMRSVPIDTHRELTIPGFHANSVGVYLKGLPRSTGCVDVNLMECLDLSDCALAPHARRYVLDAVSHMVKLSEGKIR
jgi:hypothetical protein